MGGLRLDDQAEFDEVEGTVEAQIRSHMPGKHLAVQQVPCARGPDAHAGFRPDLEHALADQHLDGLAQRIAADAEVGGKLRLNGQVAGYAIVPCDDATPQPRDDLIVQVSTADGRVAWRARSVFHRW